MLTGCPRPAVTSPGRLLRCVSVLLEHAGMSMLLRAWLVCVDSSALRRAGLGRWPLLGVCVSARTLHPGQVRHGKC